MFFRNCTFALDCGEVNHWCICFFFFKNAAENAVLEAGSLITELLWPDIEDVNLNEICFQQDGARHVIQPIKQSIFCALSSVIV